MAEKIAEDLIARLQGLIEPSVTALAATSAPCRRREYERVMLAHAKLRQRTAIQLLRVLGPEMYLDDPRILLALDRSPYAYERNGQSVQTVGMMGRLTHVPEYLLDMQELVKQTGNDLRTRVTRRRLGKVKVYGVGGSAAPAGLAKEILTNSGRLSFEFEVVRRDSPRFDAVDKETLLVFSSFSGNTEETLHCLDLAVKSGRAEGGMVAMSTGGCLKEKACQNKVPWIQIPPRVCQPRESAALQVVAILAIISELGLPSGDAAGSPFSLKRRMLEETGEGLRDLTKALHWAVPYRDNPAKQMAVKLLYREAGWAGSGAGRAPMGLPLIPIVLSSASHEAVAYELYTQLCEASKILCHVATCPEALHNLVESMKFGLVSGQGHPWSLYFMESDDDEPRVADRWCHTLQEVFPEVEPCSFKATGRTAFERSMSLYYFNAWLRLYLAFLNGAEPLPVPTMDHMKEYMKGIKRRECG